MVLSMSYLESSEYIRGEPFTHWCEACNREELLTSNEAFEAGWDFPPRMGTWGVISPRTCPNCGIEKTAWWAMAIEKRGIDEMTPHERMAIDRILEEIPPAEKSATK